MKRILLLLLTTLFLAVPSWAQTIRPTRLSLVEWIDFIPNPTCAAGDFFIWANTTDVKIKKCENGVISDLDSVGGVASWEALVNTTNTSTDYTSDNVLELVGFDFTAAYGGSDIAFQIQQLTGNPVAGSTLLDLRVSDTDMTILKAGDGTNGFLNIAGTGNVTVGQLNNVRVVDGDRFTTIQAAHDDLPSAGGIIIDNRESPPTLSTTINLSKPVTIFFGAATYTASANPTFNITGTNTRLVGQVGSSSESADGTRFTYTNTAGTFLQAGNTGVSAPVTRVVFENFKVQMSTTTNTSLALSLRFIEDSTFTNMVIRNFYRSVTLTGDQDVQNSRRIAFREFLIGNVLNTSGAWGFQIDHTTSTNFFHVEVFSFVDATLGISMILNRGVDTIAATALNLDGGLNSLLVQDDGVTGGTDGSAPSALFFEKSYFDSASGGTNIVFSSNLGTSRTIAHFSHCWINRAGIDSVGVQTASAHGVNIAGGTGIFFDDTQVSQSAAEGILLSSVGGFVMVNASQIVANNQANNTGDNGINVSAGTLIATGNRIGNILFTGGNQEYGILVSGTGHTISLNDLSGNDIGTINGGTQLGVTDGKVDVGEIILGSGAGNDKLEFVEEATNPTCAVNDYFIWANSGDTALKKCENGVISNLDTNTGGAPTWESLTNSANSATNYNSDNVLELMDYNFTAGYGATDNLIQFQQLTGNPLAGSVLLDLRASDADILVLKAGDGTNGIQLTQPGALTAIGTGSITATNLASGTIDALTDFASALCGTNEILEDQGASWACIATPVGGASRWDQLTDPTAVTIFNSGAAAELFQMNFTAAYGATDILVDLEQLTGNPVAGSVLFQLTAADADILLFRAGPTNGVQITQAGALSKIGTGTITSTDLISDVADPADAGVIRLGNAEIIGWEASPTGTDLTLTVNASEVLVSSAPIEAPSFTGTGANGFVEFPNSAAAVSGANVGRLRYDSTPQKLELSVNTGAYFTVATALENLSLFAATTSAQFFSVISNETGGTLVVGSDNPTFTTLVTVPQEVQWTEAAGDPACVAGEFWIAANDTSNLFRKCQDGAISNLDTSGAVRWDEITDPTAAIALNSNTNTELFQMNFTSALGATDVAVQIEQLTGNPVAGSILLELVAADTDILLLSAGTGANTIDITQAGAMSAQGTATIIATSGDSATSFFSTGTIEAARLPSAAAGALGVIELDNALAGTAAAVELAAGVAGDGLILNTATTPDSLDIDLNATVDGVGSASNLSGLEFTATAELALLQGCATGQILKYTTTGDLWECQNDDDTGGSPRWDQLIDPTAVMSMTSNANAELMTWSFESALGATDIGFLLRQQTGNPVAGSILFDLTATDTDILLTRWGGATNNIQITQGGVMTRSGTGSITADEIVADTIDQLTDFLGTLCGTNQILEDQGASWACINTPSGGAVRWDELTDPTAVTVFNSGATAELFQLNFTAAYGATDNLVDIEQLTGNPVAGSVLLQLTAADADILLFRAGTTNGVQITQAGAMTVNGSGSILATLGDSGTAFFSAGQIEPARGGTGQDSSGSTGIPEVASGTWSFAADISDLATSTSADLLGVLSDETGSGFNVFADNPLFPNQVRFTAIAAPSHTAGQLFYDSGDEALGFHNVEADITLQIGQEMWIRVRNETGSTITNGQVVYIDGLASGIPRIALARADVAATAEAVGIATHDIETASTGFVTTYGLVRDFDTSGFVLADRLFLSASVAGALTNTAPSDPNFVVPMGIVTEVNATTGDVFATTTPPRPRGGAGIQITGSTISTLSSEETFLVSGALSCGSSTAGKLQTHTTPLQYCDNAATPLLQFAAYGASDGDALAGDTATSFFDAGTIEAARLPSAAAATLGVIELDNALAGTAAAVELASGVAGDGLVLNTATTPDSLDIDLIDIDDQTGSASNQSGLEFGGTGGTDLGLLRACTNTQILKFNTTGGLWECAADATGGSPTLDSIADPVAVTDWIFSSTTETLLADFQAAFTTGAQFLIEQSVGNPTAGPTIFEVRFADRDPTPFAVSDGTTLQLRFDTDTDGTPHLVVTGDQTAATDADLRLRRTRSGGVITTGDSLGGIDFFGHDGTTFVEGAGIVGFSEGTIATGQVPTNIRFFTMNTSAVFAERGRITADGVFDWSSVLDANTGFRIAGAAASDDCLLGNATDFVSSANCALASDNLSFFSATTSLQLLGVLSDETGAGVAVFGTSPEFTTDIDIAVPEAANNVRIQVNATTQMIFEGSVADAAETEFRVTNCTDTAADCLITFQNADGIVVMDTTAVTSIDGVALSIGTGQLDVDAAAAGVPGYVELDNALAGTATDVELAAGVAGDGLVLDTATTPDSLDIDLIDIDDQTGSTSNQSGLEFGGTGGADLGLLRGCALDQILKFNTTGGLWECAADAGAGGGDNITINGATVTDADFDDTDPAAPSEQINVKWQLNTTPAPDSVSAYVPILAVADGVGVVASDSGFEPAGASSDLLALLQGCADTEILKWDNTATDWECQPDNDTGGSPRWDQLIDPTAVTVFNSNANAELFQLNFTSALGATDIAFDVTQLTGNPVAGSVLANFEAADADIIVAQFGDGTNGPQITQPGNFIFRTDNVNDIGATGANRPRDIYVAGTVKVQGSGFGAVDLTTGTCTVSATGEIRLCSNTGDNFAVSEAGGALQNVLLLTKTQSPTNKTFDSTNVIQAGAYAAASIDGDDINTNLAGSGLVLIAAAPDTLDIDLIDIDDQTGSASNESGMEFGGTGGTDLGLLRGCALNQILKFNTTGGLWECAADADSGGSPRWDQLTDPTAVTIFNSGAAAELLQLNFTAAYGATDHLVDIEQLTGNPVAGSVLLQLTAADADILLFRAGTTNGVEISQPGILTANGSGGLDWPALLNYPTGCTNQFVRTIGDTLTCNTVGTTDLAAGAADNTIIRDSAGFSVIGKATTGSGDPADIVAADETVFGRTAAGNLSFAALATGQVANDAITDIKLRDSAGFSVVGKTTTGSGDPADIIAGDETVFGRTAAGNLSFAALATGQIANQAVTFAKMQNISTDRLLGRDTAASGSPEEILLNSTLEFDGSLNLQRAALTGDVTASAGSNATLIAAGVVASAELATANKTFKCNFALFDDTGLSDTDDIQSISNCSRPGRAITITIVRCEVNAGSPIVNLQRDDGSPANVLSSNLTCSTGGTDGSIAAAEDNFASTDGMDFVMVSGASGANRLSMMIEYTVD